MRAYIAGPLFNESERWFDEQIDAVARRAGLDTFLPHRDGNIRMTGPADVPRIFAEDRGGVDGADMVIANLNGVTTDDGTAWEIGYAYAKGKPIIGVYTDMRLQHHFQVINLMIECSLTKLVRSLEELEVCLREYSRA